MASGHPRSTVATTAPECGANRTRFGPSRLRTYLRSPVRHWLAQQSHVAKV